jgi:predicted transcriptional regulator
MQELAKIRPLRMKLGLTQKQVAFMSGLSQSMIAKMETGALDPGYSSVQKVFTVLESAQKKEEPSVSVFMKRRLVVTSPLEGLRSVVKKMRERGISQLPVFSQGNLIGLVTESDILSAMLSGKGKRVNDVMTVAPPVVSKETSVKVVLGLLNHYPAVLVSERGKINGIVTKSDVISQI